jgi:L-alanine-DL-glutamate epimerase-like enolase superfamily enzyme
LLHPEPDSYWERCNPTDDEYGQIRIPIRFNVVNIKLDKCGGLAMARAARKYGLDAMVGNMMGTSLAMAPAFLLGQLCHIVDLDGPVFLGTDRASPVEYANDCIMCPTELWGGTASRW